MTVTKGNTGNKNYTANWSANSYYVTFNGNEGSLHVMDGTIAKIITEQLPLKCSTI